MLVKIKSSTFPCALLRYQSSFFCTYLPFSSSFDIRTTSSVSDVFSQTWGALALLLWERGFINMNNEKQSRLVIRIFGSIFLLWHFTRKVFFVLIATSHNLLEKNVTCVIHVYLGSGLFFMMMGTRWPFLVTESFLILSRFYLNFSITLCLECMTKLQTW